LEQEPWNRHVESLSDGNNGYGEEQTYVCSWCGERSPDGNAYNSLFDWTQFVCPGCHELEEIARAHQQE
jgi:rubrerythrin